VQVLTIGAQMKTVNPGVLSEPRPLSCFMSMSWMLLNGHAMALLIIVMFRNIKAESCGTIIILRVCQQQYPDCMVCSVKAAK